MDDNDGGDDDNDGGDDYNNGGDDDRSNGISRFKLWRELVRWSQERIGGTARDRFSTVDPERFAFSVTAISNPSSSTARTSTFRGAMCNRNRTMVIGSPAHHGGEDVTSHRVDCGIDPFA